MIPSLRILLPIFLILALGAIDGSVRSQDIETIRRDWENSIRPILSKHCLACHNSIESSSKLNLETIEGLVRGGLSGSPVHAEDVAKSLILEVLAPGAKIHMPPEGQVSDADIQQLNQWLIALNKSDTPSQWKPAQDHLSSKSSNSMDGFLGAKRTDQSIVASLPQGIDASLVIDLSIQEKWKANGLQPAPTIDDDRFARRIYLDLIGRVPTPDEFQHFKERKDSRKREWLIDQLLASEEFAGHFAEILDVLLIGRKEPHQLAKANEVGWMEYLKSSIQQDRPWNEMAKEMVLARPDNAATTETRWDPKGAVWYLYSRKNNHQEIAEAVSKDFFGVRIDCAQCHDHPLSPEIEQRHYWGLAAFFNRSNNVDTPKGPRVAESAIGGFSEFANLRGTSSINELVYFGRPVVHESRPEKGAKEEDRDELYTPQPDGLPKIPKFSRREQFVRSVMQDHPMIARSMVNRLWGWMMGRGLIHPVDAMDSFHPASHPELLDWLAIDFHENGYNLRYLLRQIANSRVYQLGTLRESAEDPRWFASSIAKPLTGESLYRSMLSVMAPIDQPRWNNAQTRWAFVRQFPDVMAEESLSNVSQGLLLTNGEALNALVAVEQSKLLQTAVALADNNEIVSLLFQRILLRSPDAAEQERCLEYLKNPSTRSKRIESLAWALLTSSEFRFNH